MRRLIPLLVLPALLSARGQVRPVERVVAMVNDRVVMESDVLGLVGPAEQELRGRLKDRPEELHKALDELRQKGLNLAIDRAMILEEFKASKGQLPQMAVQERLSEIVQLRFGADGAKLQNALADERKSLDDLNKEIHDEIVISLLRRQEVSDRISVSPADLRRLYEERRESYSTPERVRMRLVQIRKEGRTPEEVAAKVDGVKAALAAGRGIELIAQEFSDFAPDKGGDLGTLRRADLRADFLRALESLKPGETSGPLENADSVEFLHLLQILPATARSLEEVQPELEKELRKRSEEELYQAWVKRLRLKHPVVLYTPRN